MLKSVILCLLLVTSHVSLAKDIAAAANAVHPLLVGSSVPDIFVTTQSGEQQSFSALLVDKPTIVFFYRGGWCPFCNTQLGQLKQIEPELAALGIQLIGVSTDTPAQLQASSSKHSLNFQLISDPHNRLSQAFGLAFFTDEATTQRYLAKMELSALLQTDSQNNKRLVLPVPAVYAIDRKGVIQFNYVNPNFKIRLDPNVLLAVAKSLI